MWVVYSSHLSDENVKNSISSLIPWHLGCLFWSTSFFWKFILQNHMQNSMMPDVFVINLISQTIHAIRLQKYVHIPLRCWGLWGGTILGPHTVQCRRLENKYHTGKSHMSLYIWQLGLKLGSLISLQLSALHL